jgi:hypothetical protein
MYTKSIALNLPPHRQTVSYVGVVEASSNSIPSVYSSAKPVRMYVHALGRVDHRSRSLSPMPHTTFAWTKVSPCQLYTGGVGPRRPGASTQTDSRFRHNDMILCITAQHEPVWPVYSLALAYQGTSAVWRLAGRLPSRLLQNINASYTDGQQSQDRTKSPV